MKRYNFAIVTDQQIQEHVDAWSGAGWEILSMGQTPRFTFWIMMVHNG